MPDSVAARRAMVIERFEALLETRYSPLDLAEICLATGVSERTLRDCCHEYLAMSPIRYARLRRMQMARNALMHANPSISNVTTIANHFGFSELGRFSVSYRALFGEEPSATLRRSSQAIPRMASIKVGAGRRESAALLERLQPMPHRQGPTL
jgi:transcriptional regulator GlxA family with amidase domain